MGGQQNATCRCGSLFGSSRNPERRSFASTHLVCCGLKQTSRLRQSSFADLVQSCLCHRHGITFPKTLQASGRCLLGHLQPLVVLQRFEDRKLQQFQAAEAAALIAQTLSLQHGEKTLWVLTQTRAALPRVFVSWSGQHQSMLGMSCADVLAAEITRPQAETCNFVHNVHMTLCSKQAQLQLVTDSVARCLLWP